MNIEDGAEPGAGFVSESQAARPPDLPCEPVDFVIPYVRRNPFLSREIQHWGLAYSESGLYIFKKSRGETVTVWADDDFDDVIDVVHGRMRKRAVKKALQEGLASVLAICDYWHLLTPEELSGVRTRRNIFRFRIMFPEMDGQKKFSLVVRNKYRKGFRQHLRKLQGPN
jgi:hypothetical protein